MQKVWGKRGKFLTILIVLSLISHIYILYLTVLQASDTSLTYQGIFDSPLYKITSILISLIIFYGWWIMKKWSVYLWIVQFVVSLIQVSITLDNSWKAWEKDPILNPTILIIFFALVMIFSFLIPAWAIKRKWKDFS